MMPTGECFDLFFIYSFFVRCILHYYTNVVFCVTRRTHFGMVLRLVFFLNEEFFKIRASARYLGGSVSLFR